MAKVNATAKILVEIKKEDALNVLIEEFGLDKILNPKDNEFWSLNDKEDKLLRFVDCSYHGSPHFKEDTESTISDTKTIQLYKSLFYIMETIKEENL